MWLFDEFKALMGVVGFALVRIDQCTVGTPYMKGQLWLTNNLELAADGAVCLHPTPHPDKLTGSKTRASAPYPERLADIIVRSFVRAYDTGRNISDETVKLPDS